MGGEELREKRAPLNFVHAIVIRFNVPRLFGDRYAGTRVPVADDAWLRHRQRLFTEYTLSSLDNQNESRFVTYCLYDSESPQWLKETNSHLQRAHSHFEPLYVHSHDEGIRLVDQRIGEIGYSKGKTHAIVTRLDNDDALHRDAVSRIQAEFSGQDYLILNFDGILTFRPGKGEMLTYYRYPNGPFLSEISRLSDQYHTRLFEEYHTAWLRKTDVVQLGPFPYAMQILHDRNVSNNVRGKVVPVPIMEEYGFSYRFRTSIARRKLVNGLVRSYRGAQKLFFKIRRRLLRLVGTPK